MALAIAFGHRQHLRLRAVALLALDKAVGRLGQHGRCSGEQAVAGVDFVGVAARDDEEGNAVAYLGNPAGLLVEAWLDGGLRGIVPDHPIALLVTRNGTQTWGRRWPCSCASTRRCGRDDRESPPDSDPGRSSARRRAKRRWRRPGKRRVRGTLIVQNARVAVLVIGHGHRPALHIKQRISRRRAEGDVGSGSGAVEEFGDIQLRRQGLAGPWPIGGDRHAEPAGLVGVSLLSLLMAPARSGRRGRQTVSWSSERRLLEQAQSDAHDVRRVGLENDGAATAVQHHPRLLRRRSGSKEQSKYNPTGKPQRHVHLQTAAATMLHYIRIKSKTDAPGSHRPGWSWGEIRETNQSRRDD